MSFRSSQEAMRAPWVNRSSPNDANITKVDYAKSNNFFDFMRNKAGTGLLPLYGADTDNLVHFAGAGVVGQRMVKTFTLTTSASITSMAFWIADNTYTVTDIQCNYATNDGATNTAFIGKATGTTTPASASTLMTGTFNMNTTANTVQVAALVANWNAPSAPSITLVKGDRLCFVLASAVTSLAGVTITVTMVPGNKSLTAEYVMNLNGDLIAASTFFLSQGEYIITGAQVIWSTAGTGAGTVTYDITKDVSTNAAGAGTSILTAAVSLKTTANTVSVPALTTTTPLATLRMTQSDRLGIKLNGTLTSLAGVVVVVSLQPIQSCIEVGFNLAKNANLAVDTAFFVADRTYEFICGSVTFATTNGAALTMVFTRESGTTAPGSGTSLISGTLNLGGTANTPAFATLLGVQSNYLLRGDRLSVHYSTTATNIAGLCATAKLIPR